MDGDDICRRDARGRTWSLPGNQGPWVPDQGTDTICSCDRVPCAGSVANRGPKRFLWYSNPLLCSVRNAAISDAHEIARRSICFGPKVMQTIIDSPSSPYAEAIRSIKLTVDLNSRSKYEGHWPDIVLTKRGQIHPCCGDGDAHSAGWRTCHFSGL